MVILSMEAAIGFEPMNRGFANRCLRPLDYAAPCKIRPLIVEIFRVCQRNGVPRRDFIAMPRHGGARTFRYATCLMAERGGFEPPRGLNALLQV